MSDKVSTIALRAIACDIEDCEQPQSWADAMRAAVSEIEKLRAALKQARRNALEEAAQWHDERVKLWQNTYVKETLSGLDMQAARVMCLEHGGFHIESAAAIRAALGEKK